MTTRDATLEAGYITTDLLLGADRLAWEFRRRYQAFFLGVVRQRGFPLHTASLWNALYFGWSLPLHGYLGRGLRTSMADASRPVPVGSFVEVPVGGSRILLAELVYKEGRDDRIDKLGIVSPAASGARLGLARAREEAEVREGLILDFDAFGDGLNDAGEVTYARAERRGLLTEDRHKEVVVSYPADDAGVDDLTLFARQVFNQHGGTLFNDLLRDGGADTGLDERWEFLLRSLQAVDELANDAPGLRTFGLYHVDRARYEEDLADTSDAPFGAYALRELADAATEVVPARGGQARGWRSDGRPSFRSVGSLVREQLGRGGLDEAKRALLSGPGYARLVIEVNLAIVDRIGRDGIDAERGCHVRLDDEWQGGGIWRTVCYTGTQPPEVRFGPLVALGLGYAESAGLTQQDPPPEPEQEVAEPTQRGWRIPLRAVDLDHRHLPLCPEALAVLPGDATEVLVDFADGLGEPVRRRRPLDRTRRFVEQMLYPATFVPGTYVSYVVGMGGIMLSVRATPLPVPRELEGRQIRHEFNERLFLRDVGLAPLDPADLRKARSLTEEISAVFRRRGRMTADGGRALRSEEIIGALLGSLFDPTASLPILLRLQIGDYDLVGGEYIWHPRLSRRTSPRERNRLLAVREQTEATLRRALAPRMVPMGLRHYVLRHPSAAKVASYAAARVKYHMETKLPETLPPDHSWVEPYLLAGE